MEDVTPRNILLEGRNEAKDEVALQEMHEYAKTLYDKGFPIIFTLKHLSLVCKVSYNFLREIVATHIKPYRVFYIKKQNGRKRQITAPDPQLLKVQKWINKFILMQESKNIPTSVTAYKKGTSPLKNAQQHLAARFLIKSDIQDFFINISERQVYKVFRSFGYNPLLSFEMARLTTIAGRKQVKSPKKYSIYSESIKSRHLPQGAPTSPMLANIVCKSMDYELEKLAVEKNLTYTRYSDDIVFSSYQKNISRSEAKDIIKEIRSVLHMHGFKQNPKKTTYVPIGSRKIVTGIVVDKQETLLRKEYRHKIEGYLKFAKKYGVIGFCDMHKKMGQLYFYNYLNGLITYATSIELKRGMAYREEFNKLDFDRDVISLTTT
ncbi:reverse transcriptase family protein [Deferribacterales bacterium RsTz2092]